MNFPIFLRLKFFFEILLNELNIMDFEYAFVTRFLITIKKFPGDLTKNLSTVG